MTLGLVSVMALLAFSPLSRLFFQEMSDGKNTIGMAIGSVMRVAAIVVLS